MSDASHAERERAYWRAIHVAAARLAASAEFRALDPACSGGRMVYEDMRAMRAAMEAPRHASSGRADA